MTNGCLISIVYYIHKSHNCIILHWKRGVVKNGYFTVRLTVRGGGPLALTVSNCENFEPLKKDLKQCFWTKKTCFFAHTIKEFKKAVRKGEGVGGSTLTVSLTVKYPFIYDSPQRPPIENNPFIIWLMTWSHRECPKKSCGQNFEGISSFFGTPYLQPALRPLSILFLVALGDQSKHHNAVTQLVFISPKNIFHF